MTRRGLGRSGSAPGERFLVPAEHEKQEAQPVEPSAYLLVAQSVRPLERDAAALGPAGYSAREIKGSRSGRRAGKDEAVGHGHRLFELGDQRIEAYGTIDEASSCLLYTSDAA